MKQTGNPADERARDNDATNAKDAAISEWSIATGAVARDPVAERLKRLENPTLSIAHDSPTPYDIARPNPLGTVKGYNPYDSGKLDQALAAPRKKDLRKLSEWLKLKKQHQNNKDDEE